MAVAEVQETFRGVVRHHYELGITDPDKIASMVDVRNAADELIDECIREAIKACTTAIQQDIRGGWKSESVRPSTVNAGTAMEAAKARARRLFDSWIVNGTPLGRCVKGDLQSAATEERGRAQGHVVNATFYESLASKLSGKKMVETVLTEEEALKLLKAAQAA